MHDNAGVQVQKGAEREEKLHAHMTTSETCSS